MSRLDSLLHASTRGFRHLLPYLVHWRCRGLSSLRLGPPRSIAISPRPGAGLVHGSAKLLSGSVGLWMTISHRELRGLIDNQTNHGLHLACPNNCSDIVTLDLRKSRRNERKKGAMGPHPSLLRVCRIDLKPVSYTHLTLPTIYSV